jgi:hypothetical protein
MRLPALSRMGGPGPGRSCGPGPVVKQEATGVSAEDADAWMDGRESGRHRRVCGRR